MILAKRKMILIKSIGIIILLISNCYASEALKGNGLKNNENNKTVSLVLGSGGARGYAHIGVIEVLEQKGYKIESIAGSSMGALIGGLYAAGKLDEYKNWALNLDYYDIYKLLTISSSNGGIINAQKVFDKIAFIIGDVNIEDLPIKYQAVATDVMNRKTVVFKKGKLIDAIRASISIPTIFLPIYKNDQILVDGGILNPLPIDLVNKDDTDLKIVVNLDADIDNKYTVDIPQDQLSREERFSEKFYNLIDEAESMIPKNILDTVKKYTASKNEIKQEKETKKDIFYILGKTLDTAQSVLAQYIMKDYKADIIVEIPRESCEFYEFTKAYKMIDIGKQATLGAL